MGENQDEDMAELEDQNVDDENDDKDDNEDEAEPEDQHVEDEGQ